MKKTLKDKLSDKLVNAFLKNKIISAIPKKFTKKLTEADKFRKLCESKIKEPVIGFKAAGTGIPVMKKLKEKEPFYATVYKHNVLKNKASVSLNANDIFNSDKMIIQTYLPIVNTYMEYQRRPRQVNLSFTYRFNNQKNEKEKQPVKNRGENGDGMDF